MDDQRSHLLQLLDLESRHDDLLVRLEELDKQVAKVLAECSAAGQTTESVGGRATGRQAVVSEMRVEKRHAA